MPVSAADVRSVGDFRLGTGARVLVEASLVDRVWGTGLAADHEHSGSLSTGPG